MRLSAAPLPRVTRLAAAVVVGLGAITVVAAPAHAATAAFVKESQWPTSYIGKMTLASYRKFLIAIPQHYSQVYFRYNPIVAAPFANEF